MLGSASIDGPCPANVRPMKPRRIGRPAMRASRRLTGGAKRCPGRQRHQRLSHGCRKVRRVRNRPGPAQPSENRLGMLNHRPR
jgi:hypothetical protein